VPISAQLKYNIDAVNEYIVTKIPVPIRDFTSDPKLIVIRSFDVNKPGAEVEDLKGGVAGGSILTGVLRVNLSSNPLCFFAIADPSDRSSDKRSRSGRVSSPRTLRAERAVSPSLAGSSRSSRRRTRSSTPFPVASLVSAQRSSRVFLSLPLHSSSSFPD
jgi:hypothetical protein